MAINDSNTDSDPSNYIWFNNSHETSGRDSELGDRELNNQALRRTDAALEKLQVLEEQIKSVKNELKNEVARTNESANDVEKLRDDIQEIRNKTLEPLAVFVGLFTFISVSFQMFTNVNKAALWVPLLLVMMGAIGLFVALVLHASSVSGDKNNRRNYTTFLIVISLIVLALGFISYQSSKTDMNTNRQACLNTATSVQRMKIDDFSKALAACNNN